MSTTYFIGVRISTFEGRIRLIELSNLQLWKLTLSRLSQGTSLNRYIPYIKKPREFVNGIGRIAISSQNQFFLPQGDCGMFIGDEKHLTGSSVKRRRYPIRSTYTSTDRRLRPYRNHGNYYKDEDIFESFSSCTRAFQVAYRAGLCILSVASRQTSGEESDLPRCLSRTA